MTQGETRESLALAEADLLDAASIGDLQGMREALQAGARPHFWCLLQEDIFNPDDWESPVTMVLYSRKYEEAVKIRALDILYDAGLRFCSPSPHQVKSAMGSLLPSGAGQFSNLIEWFVSRKLGISIEEGVGHWLEHSLSDFKNDFAARILEHIAQLAESKPPVPVFPLMAQAALLVAPGRCCVVMSNPNADKEVRELAEGRLSAFASAWPLLCVGELIEKTGKTPSGALATASLLDFSQIYPDSDRILHALSTFQEAMTLIDPAFSTQDWKASIDTFSYGKVAHNDPTMRDWACEQARSWIAGREAQLLEGNTLTTPSASPRVRL